MPKEYGIVKLSQFYTVGLTSIQDHLRRSTTNLQRWLSRVNHQKKVSQFMSERCTYNQLMLRDSFKRANVMISDYQKFPPSGNQLFIIQCVVRLG